MPLRRALYRRDLAEFARWSIEVRVQPKQKLRISVERMNCQ
jgi:hypothetical protein